MNDEIELSDNEILSYVPSKMKSQCGAAAASVFCESIRIVVATFISAQKTFDRSDEYTAVKKLHTALELAIKRKNTTNFSDLAAQFESLSDFAHSQWKSRAARIGLVLPTADNLRTPATQVDAAERLRSIIQYGIGEADAPSWAGDLDTALILAIRTKKNTDFSDVAARFESLSAYARSQLKTRAGKIGLEFPTADDLRASATQVDAADRLRSINHYGMEPLLWVREKRPKSFKKNVDDRVLLAGLAVAWDAAFALPDSKHSATTRSQRSTPTPFVEFASKLCERIKPGWRLNIVNIVNKLPQLPAGTKNKNPTGNS